MATPGLIVGGYPCHLFSEADIGRFLSLARSLGLTLTDPIDLSCHERAVRWEKYRLDYTFLVLTLRKALDHERSGVSPL